MMMSVEGRFIPFAACVVAAAIAASACTSGQSKEPPTSAPPSSTITIGTPTVSPSPSANTYPGEKPPTLPSTAKQHTESGALDFGGYYYQAFDWGYATNDPNPVAEISAPTCDACNRYLTGLRDILADHGYITGGRITINSASIVTGTFKVKSEYTILVNLSEQPVIVHMPGASPSTAASSQDSLESLVSVSWVEGRWLVLGVGEPS